MKLNWASLANACYFNVRANPVAWQRTIQNQEFSQLGQVMTPKSSLIGHIYQLLLSLMFYL